MDGWIQLWTWIYIVGFIIYAAVALVLIPLGGRDIARMFATLKAQARRNDSDGA